jgi:metal-responsive CopG/Arc/MetJ family transcriptional regulator
MATKPREPDPRIIVPIPKPLLAKVDEYRWTHRLASRAAAIRRLLEDALNRNHRR